MEGARKTVQQLLGFVIVCTLLFALQYASRWVFRSVEDPYPSSIGVLADQFAVASHSLSPARTQTGQAAIWNIATVTNRSTAATAAGERPRPAGPASLSAQVVAALNQMPETTYGVTEVQVSLNRGRGNCTLDPSLRDAVIVQPTTTTTPQQFLTDLREQVDRAEAKDVFVFVHGFNVSAQQSIARAAQMAEDMPFHGVVVSFSWPSQAKTGSYLQDEQIAERYFWNLAELLAQLRSEFDATVRLHVLAHSMGNRVTLRALNALCGTLSPTGGAPDVLSLASRGDAGTEHTLVSSSVIGQSSAEIKRRFPQWANWRRSALTRPTIQSLVLAAPDVDADEFTRLVKQIQHACHDILLCASDSDVALEASRKVHGGAYRAGDSRARLQIDGIHTMRVSGVDALDPLGHSYYGSNRIVLTRLSQMMRPPLDMSKPIASFTAESVKSRR